MSVFSRNNPRLNSSSNICARINCEKEQGAFLKPALSEYSSIQLFQEVKTNIWGISCFSDTFWNRILLSQDQLRKLWPIKLGKLSIFMDFIVRNAQNFFIFEISFALSTLKVLQRLKYPSPFLSLSFASLTIL